mmetsp:Transcript_42826/g.135146  ORF Transcript_42826/g.135146 Transcript_42826/m.135146 type:complete len:279 (+) Transcript_42826:824-1660(+)
MDMHPSREGSCEAGGERRGEEWASPPPSCRSPSCRLTSSRTTSTCEAGMRSSLRKRRSRSSVVLASGCSLSRPRSPSPGKCLGSSSPLRARATPKRFSRVSCAGMKTRSLQHESASCRCSRCAISSGRAPDWSTHHTSIVERTDSGCEGMYPRSHGRSPSCVHSSSAALPNPIARSRDSSSSAASCDSSRSSPLPPSSASPPSSPPASAVASPVAAAAVPSAVAAACPAHSPASSRCTCCRCSGKSETHDSHVPLPGTVSAYPSAANTGCARVSWYHW